MRIEIGGIGGGFLSAESRIHQQQARCESQPKQREIKIELTHLFEDNPRSRRQRLTIPLIVGLRVPVPLVVALPIHVVVLVHGGSGDVPLREVVVINSEFVVEVTEALLSVERAPRFMVVPMAFVSPQEI